MDLIDKTMIHDGYVFVRYMDDMRVFCENVTKARQAVLRLTELARQLGLVIQDRKTRIYAKEDAVTAWRGYGAWLEELKEEELRNTLSNYFANWGPYGEIANEDPQSEEMEEIEEINKIEEKVLCEMFDLITNERAYKLDRKGLRFILPGLAAFDSDYALDYCLKYLAELPDLAPVCSEYFSNFADRQNVQERIAQFISSEECIYDWQAMHLVAAMLQGEDADPKLLGFTSKVAQNRNRDIGLRSICIDFLGQHGSEVEVQQLCRSFGKEFSEEVRAATILASQKLHHAERKRFLGACKGFSPALDAAVGIASRR